ncbi:hypothetical protein GCM10023093_08750 [Nemorincola caseinilytica]|uniref:Transposase IS200-like domain-containing protein n=1 Tax=Nemorincola caseinilytica TaxID=2054315 RepID=A0ABP8NB58_9BACT
MSVNNPHIFDTGIYFITFTASKWIPLFSEIGCYDLVYKWFDVLKSKGHSILGYVIMPNHVHVLIGFLKNEQSINTIIGSGKRFMAYGIVSRLKEQAQTSILKILEDGVSAYDRKKGQLHKVFEGKQDILLCHSYKFVTQKLNYIHSNPSSKKWALVANVSDYMHSSAGYYLLQRQGKYEVEHVNKWIAENWK